MWFLRTILCFIGGGVIGHALPPMETPDYWIGIVGMVLVIISQNIE